MALYIQPAIAAVEALGDRRRWLGRRAKTFHTERPCLNLGAIRLEDGLYRPFASMLSIDLGRSDAAAPDHFAGIGAVHGGDYSGLCAKLQCHWDWADWATWPAAS